MVEVVVVVAVRRLVVVAVVHTQVAVRTAPAFRTKVVALVVALVAAAVACRRLVAGHKVVAFLRRHFEEEEDLPWLAAAAAVPFRQSHHNPQSFLAECSTTPWLQVREQEERS